MPTPTPTHNPTPTAEPADQTPSQSETPETEPATEPSSSLNVHSLEDALLQVSGVPDNAQQKYPQASPKEDLLTRADTVAECVELIYLMIPT